MLWSSVAFAQDAAAKSPSFLEQMFPFIFLFIVLWFLMIRPQQKKMKLHNEFLNNLKRGDEVLTSGGIYGVVEGLNDRFVTLEIANDTKIRILKNQIVSSAKEEVKK